MKKKGEFVENLLESDNPIMSGIDEEPEPVLNSKKSVMKKIKKFVNAGIGAQKNNLAVVNGCKSRLALESALEANMRSIV